MPLAGARAVGERISGEKAFARGERVAFLAPPGVDFVKTLLGVWQVGGVAVPLCVTHPEAELRYAMSEADACVVAAASDVLAARAQVEAMMTLTLNPIPIPSPSPSPDPDPSPSPNPTPNSSPKP